MYNTQYDNKKFAANSSKSLIQKVGKYIRDEYGSFEEKFNGNKCYHSDNYSRVKLVLVLDGESYLEYKNSPYFCGQTGCKCKSLNPISFEFLITCGGLTEIQARTNLKAKGRKSFNTSLNNPNTTNAAALAKLGFNPMSKSELLKKFGDEDLVQEYLVSKGLKGRETLRDTGWYNDISNNPFSKDFWIKRGQTEEEALYSINSRNFWCEEFKEKHPDTLYENPSKLQYWIIKCGLEEGTRLFEEMREKNSYFNTLDGYIEKHGLELGTIKYKQRLASTSGHLGSTSRESKKFFVKLYKKLRRIGYLRNEITFGIKGSKEFVLKDDILIQAERYDFCLLPLKIIIEYNGSIWHPRKDKLSEEKYRTWRMPFHPNTTAEEKELKDTLKNNFGKDHGYDIIEIWDYQSVEEKLKICLERIYEARSKENCSV